MYRISALLNEQVDADILQTAANDVLPRFPTMKVELRKGFFWYYFGENTAEFKVAPEITYPGQMIKTKRRNYLFRILYQDRRVIMETFHSVTDGTGAFLFLNTLLRRYFELKGKPVTGYDGCLNYLDKPAAEEIGDSFIKTADFKTFAPRKESKAYHMKLAKSERGVLWVTYGTASVSQIKEAAKKHNVSIGPFIAAAFMYAINKCKESRPNNTKNKQIKLSITTDMRRMFNSRTARNFAMYMNMGVQCGAETTFGDILAELSKKYAIFDREYCLSVINSNVRTQKNPLVALMPLFIKVPAMRFSFMLFGEGLNTTTYSNLGTIETPPEFKNYI